MEKNNPAMRYKNDGMGGSCELAVVAANVSGESGQPKLRRMGKEGLEVKEIY